MMTSFFTRWQF